MATEDRGTCRLLAVLGFIPKHRLERLVHLAPGQRVHIAHTHCRLDCEYGVAHRLQSLPEFFHTLLAQAVCRAQHPVARRLQPPHPPWYRTQGVVRHCQESLAHSPVRAACKRTHFCLNRYWRDTIDALHCLNPRIHPRRINGRQRQMGMHGNNGLKRSLVFQRRMGIPQVFAHQLCDGQNSTSRLVFAVTMPRPRIASSRLAYSSPSCDEANVR